MSGATGATTVAPTFSDTLTLFQPWEADSAPTSQRSHQTFPNGYSSVRIPLPPSHSEDEFLMYGPLR